MSGKYDDIIHLSRPVSGKRVPMPRSDRAAQFSPFAALTGYEAVIEETGRLTDTRVELTESGKAELNEKLWAVQENIHLKPAVTVTCFREDDRKAGGAYVQITGRVKKIDTCGQLLVLTDGTCVPISGIYGLELQ